MRYLVQFVKMISELYHFKLSVSFHLAVGDDVIPVSLVDLVNCVNHTVLYFAWTTYLQDLSNFRVFYILQSNLMLCGSSVATVVTDVFQLNWFSGRNKIGKIAKIFVKIEDPENRGVI